MTKPLTLPAKLRQNVVKKASAYFAEKEKAYIGVLKDASAKFVADISSVATFEPDAFTPTLKEVARNYLRAYEFTAPLVTTLDAAVYECVQSLNSQLPDPEQAQFRDAAERGFRSAVDKAVCRELARMENTLFYPEALSADDGRPFTVETATENVRQAVDAFAKFTVS